MISASSSSTIATATASDTTFFRNVYEFYSKYFSIDVNEYISGSSILHLPKLSSNSLLTLLKDTSQVFANEPPVLSLEPPIVIVGDIHGQILDLFRILRNLPPLPIVKFLFLGDLVDRGQFSTETVILVFVMKILYPENVYVIRGNHEFREVFEVCGFRTEIVSTYSDEEIVDEFENVFSMMPLAATIRDSFVCVHGGIGPCFISLDSIRYEYRPMKKFGRGAIEDILWSDPFGDEEANGFSKSKRGSGHIFGGDSLEMFLATSKYKMLIRGHQCVDEGVQFMFDKKLATVFSASNYCGITGNKSGIMKIAADETYEIETFDSLPLLKRNAVIFDNSKSTNDFKNIRTTFNKKPVLPKLSALGSTELREKDMETNISDTTLSKTGRIVPNYSKKAPKRIIRNVATGRKNMMPRIIL